MKSKFKVRTGVLNEVLSIPQIVIFSVFLFMNSVFSTGCEGAGNWFRRAQMDHRHAAIPEAGYMPFGCLPGTPNSACGITAGSVFDGQNCLISGIQADKHQGTALRISPGRSSPQFFFVKARDCSKIHRER